MKARNQSKRLPGYIVVFLMVTFGIFLVWNGINSSSIGRIITGVVLVVIALGVAYLMANLRVASQEGVTSRVNKDFPEEKRTQVFAMLNRYNGDLKDSVQDLILANAKGNLAIVDQLSKIASDMKDEGGDFRDVIAAVSNAAQDINQK